MIPVVRLKRICANAARFLSLEPPIAPRIAVAVVPTLAPITKAAACSKFKIPVKRALWAMAMEAELLWIIAVRNSPTIRKTRVLYPLSDSIFV